MRLLVLALAIAATLTAGCGSGQPAPPTSPTPPGGAGTPGGETGSGGSGGTGGAGGSSGTSAQTYDLDRLGIPRFVTHDYIDLSVIARISRFRSAVGHDYHDDAETCRSMKHYFQPRPGIPWQTVAIQAPVTGTIALTRAEWAGTQIAIRAASHPAFTVVLFHVSPSIALGEGTPVTAGQPIGTHVGDMTMSDVAVWVETPAGRRLVSWFDVMSDAVFDGYAARGVPSREAAVIARGQRDADPLACNGEAFTTSGSTADWLPLR